MFETDFNDPAFVRTVPRNARVAVPHPAGMADAEAALDARRDSIRAAVQAADGENAKSS